MSVAYICSARGENKWLFPSFLGGIFVKPEWVRGSIKEEEEEDVKRMRGNLKCVCFLLLFFLLLRLPRTRLTEWPMHQVFFLLLLLEYYAWKKADRLYFERGKIKVGHWPRNEKSFFRYYSFLFRQTQGKQWGRRWHFGAFLPSIFVNRRVGSNSVTDLISCVDVWMAIVIRPLVLCAFLLDRFQASADRSKKATFFSLRGRGKCPEGLWEKERRVF